MADCGAARGARQEASTDLAQRLSAVPKKKGAASASQLATYVSQLARNCIEALVDARSLDAALALGAQRLQQLADGSGEDEERAFDFSDDEDEESVKTSSKKTTKRDSLVLPVKKQSRRRSQLEEADGGLVLVGCAVTAQPRRV